MLKSCEKWRHWSWWFAISSDSVTLTSCHTNFIYAKFYWCWIWKLTPGQAFIITFGSEFKFWFAFNFTRYVRKNVRNWKFFLLINKIRKVIDPAAYSFGRSLKMFILVLWFYFVLNGTSFLQIHGFDGQTTDSESNDLIKILVENNDELQKVTNESE